MWVFNGVRVIEAEVVGLVCVNERIQLKQKIFVLSVK